MKKLLFFSDTHGKHSRELAKYINDADADIVIFTGDFVEDRFSEVSYTNFFQWFSTIKATKIMIAGNHDFLLSERTFTKPQLLDEYGIHYLENEALEIEGIKFFGSPIVVKRLLNKRTTHAVFYKQREDVNETFWDFIPSDTNVLLTHGPAFGIGDSARGNTPTGCIHLLNKLGTLKDLKVHAFGHIHEAHGLYYMQELDWKFVAINSSIVDQNYGLKNKPIIFNYEL